MSVKHKINFSEKYLKEWIPTGMQSGQPLHSERGNLEKQGPRRTFCLLLSIILIHVNHKSTTMTLIFVYNTDSNPISSLIDLGRKILSPETYDCSLCKLTHGPFTEIEAWKAFRISIGVPVEFLHRDEFEKKYERNFRYPVILKKNVDFEVLLPKEEIDGLDDLDALIAAVKKHLPSKE